VIFAFFRILLPGAMIQVPVIH